MSAAAALESWPRAAGLATARLPGGHINDTYVVGARAFVLQRINRRVFADPTAVMRNLAALCRRDRRIVAPLPTRTGASFAQVDGETWRLFPYIGGGRSFERLPAALVEPAARAFGGFQAAMAGFPGQLAVVIPGFHDLGGYLAALWRAEEAWRAGRTGRPAMGGEGPRKATGEGPRTATGEGPRGTATGEGPRGTATGEGPRKATGEGPRTGTRRGGAAPANPLDAELHYVRRRRPFEFDAAGSRTVIHGDCKVNNLLFDDQTTSVLRLIDLDTAMHGHPAWDFGDLVRSVASGAEEAHGRFELDAATFRRVASGFVRGVDGIQDAAAFAAAPGHMSFMLGVRFLADWCEGDRYFRVTHRDGNLHRARAQFEAARRFDTLEGEFRRVLERI